MLPDSQQSASTAVRLCLDQRGASNAAASTSGRRPQDAPLYRGPLSGCSRHAASRQVPPHPAAAHASGVRQQQQQQPSCCGEQVQQQVQSGGTLRRVQEQACAPAQRARRGQDLRDMGFPPWAAARAQEPCTSAAALLQRAREFKQLLPELPPPPSSWAECAASPLLHP